MGRNWERSETVMEIYEEKSLFSVKKRKVNIYNAVR